jgi:hypothetical protein
MRVILFAGFGVLLSLTSSWAQATQLSISAATYRALTCARLCRRPARFRERALRCLACSLVPAGLTTPGQNQPSLSSGQLHPVPQPRNLRDANNQMDALEQASIASQCSIDFQRPARTYPR